MTNQTEKPELDNPIIPEPKRPVSPLVRFLRQFIIVLVILLLVGYIYNAIHTQSQINKQSEVPFAQLVSWVRQGRVDSLMVRGARVEVVLDNTEKTKHITKRDPEVPISELLLQYGVTSDQLSDVDITTRDGGTTGYIIMIAGNLLLPVGMIVLLIYLFSRYARKGGMGAGMNFGASRARQTEPEKKLVTFADVAGNREAKVELAEVVDFLKNPKKYLDIGAKIPKGLLMTGSPGTGKTLLARAVAGEANVPFFYLSGSEFVEMFVGVGASRVRDLFEKAKEVAPAIVFIDEIDAVGRHRGIGIGGGNDEREQTLNQILVEMDGFEPTQTIIVIAATNRPDVLDEALLRPGRFDRRIVLDLPDRSDRRDILEIHARKKKISLETDLQKIAERTVGFSGAELESVMNEAALLAARGDKEFVEQSDLFAAVERVMMGPERLSHKHTEQEKKLVAYHEAGHAVVASVLPYADPVHKVSIVARGHAGGYTMKLPLEDKKLHTRQEYLDDIAMSMAGGVAERIFLGGDVTSGPSGDIQSSTKLARAMVTRWGMSDSVGPVLVDNSDGDLYRGAGSHQVFSEKMSALIDDEIRSILVTATQRAQNILTEYRALLDTIAQKLLEVETIEQAEFNQLLRDNGIAPKE